MDVVHARGQVALMLAAMKYRDVMTFRREQSNHVRADEPGSTDDQNAHGSEKTPPEQKIAGDKEKEDHRDNAIHGEERGVQAAEIVGGDQGVLVSQKQANHDHSDHCHEPKVKHCNQYGEK